MSIALSGTSLLLYVDPQADALSNGQSVTAAQDYSGNNRTLAASGSAPSYVTPAVNGRAAIRWSGSNTPLVSSANITLSCGFIVAKINQTTFSNYGGLLTDTTTAPILVGNSGTANFFDFSGTPAYAMSLYSLNGTGYSQSSMIAPMNAFKIIFFQFSSPVSMTGIKIGQDRNDTSRGLNGDLALMALYGAGHIYGDAGNRLAAIQTLASMFAVTLPAPDVYTLGYVRERYYEYAPDWAEVTVSHLNQDKGRSFNELSNAAPLQWEMTYVFDKRIAGDLSVMNAFDNHFNSFRVSRPFNFTDKQGITQTNVYYKEYVREHEAHKSWLQRRRISLIKYP